MTKIVIPPPQQPFVDDKTINEPWRRHLDITNYHVNSASQLISVTPVTVGSTGYTVKLPTGWRRYQLVVYNLTPATTSVTPYLQVSPDGGATFVSTNYRRITHTLDDTTAANIAAASAASRIYFDASNLTTGSTGGFTAEIDVVRVTTPRPLMFYKGMYSVENSTPSLSVFWGGASVGCTAGEVNALLFATTAGTLTTGSIALYGDR